MSEDDLDKSEIEYIRLLAEVPWIAINDKGVGFTVPKLPLVRAGLKYPPFDVTLPNGVIRKVWELRQIKTMVYVGPDEELKNKSALVSVAGGQLLAQFNDVLCKCAFGWWPFNAEDFRELNENEQRIEADKGEFLSTASTRVSPQDRPGEADSPNDPSMGTTGRKIVVVGPPPGAIKGVEIPAAPPGEA